MTTVQRGQTDDPDSILEERTKSSYCRRISVTMILIKTQGDCRNFSWRSNTFLLFSSLSSVRDSTYIRFGEKRLKSRKRHGRRRSWEFLLVEQGATSPRRSRRLWITFQIPWVQFLSSQIDPTFLAVPCHWLTDFDRHQRTRERGDSQRVILHDKTCISTKRWNKIYALTAPRYSSTKTGVPKNQLSSHIDASNFRHDTQSLKLLSRTTSSTHHSELQDGPETWESNRASSNEYRRKCHAERRSDHRRETNQTTSVRSRSRLPRISRRAHHSRAAQERHEKIDQVHPRSEHDFNKVKSL